MQKQLLRSIQCAVCLGFLSFQVQNGFAQSPKHLDGNKYKTATDLRELKISAVNSIQARSRMQAPSGPQKLDLLQVKNGYVAIDAVAAGPDGQELLRQLQQLGLKKGVVYKRVVSGFFPIEKISELEKIKPLNMVSPAYKLQHSVGAATSQGDSAMLANVARQKYKVTGVGSKVGIISDSYGADPDGVAAGIKSGDLPADAQILADAEDETDEGRGMAEIVHDVAPGAKIAFHTALGGQAVFAAGIQNLAQAGCNIIVDDITYLAEPMFQDGIIAQSVDEAVKKNVTYFSAAGNLGRQSYQAPYRNVGVPLIIKGINYGYPHDFGNGDITQTIQIPAGGSFLIPFQWDDPFYSVSGGNGALTDMDVLVFYNGNLLTSLSSMGDNIGGDPFEIVGIASNSTITIEIVIVKYTGPDPQIMKWVDWGNAIPQEHTTNSSTIYGHYNAQSTISVGAVAWFNTPQYNKNINRPIINYYSSAGGTPVIISPTGYRLVMDASTVRQKPDVVGPDGGNTTFFGSDIARDADDFPNFFGTSAAAPHLAAVAALMQQIRRNSLSPADIINNLKTSAIDMDDPQTPNFDSGFDQLTGYGFVQAIKVLENIQTYDCNLSLITKVIQALPGATWSSGLGAIDLTVRGGTGPYTYRWNSRMVTEDLSRITPGLYTVTVTDATGCSATTAVNVGVTGNPLTLSSSHNNTSRSGTSDGSVNLSVIGGTAPYTFNWSNGMNTEDLVGVSAGVYSVTVTDATGATAFTSVYVSEPSKPLALHIAHNNASRRGANDGSTDLTVIGGVAPYKYKWNAGSTMEDLPRVIPGWYQVTVTDATGATATISVQVGVRGTNSNLMSRKPEGGIDSGVIPENKTTLVAYPNPVLDHTTIAFSLTQDSDYSLNIYDLKGSLVKKLQEGKAQAGSTVQVTWVPQGTAKGIYLVQFKSENEVQNLRLVVE